MSTAQAAVEALFYVHTVTVEQYQGLNGNGQDTFAAPQSVVGFYDGSRKLVRDANGEEVISQSTFYTNPANSTLFAVNARVTYKSIPSRVLGIQYNESGALGLPDHVAVQLT